MTRWLLIPGALLFALAGIQAQPPKPRAVPPVLFTPQSALDLAHADAKRIAWEGGTPSRYRWISCYYATSKAELQEAYELVGFVTNSLNFLSVARCLPERVDAEGRLLRINIEKLHIDLKALDRLGKEGSGVAPYPEPYFHQVIQAERVIEEVVEEPFYYPGGKASDGKEYAKGTYYRKVVKKVTKTDVEIVAQPRHLDKDKLLELIAWAGTEFPIFRADWFCYYATLPPTYHLFQGDPRTLADFQKLAGVDAAALDKQRGVRLRGAALFSEVASRNRILELDPSPYNYGRGYLATSYDYLSSIKKNDLLRNVLNRDKDANELIWMTPNGFQGYGIVDGQNKRIDQADSRVATDNRTKLHDKTIYSGRNCMMCHAEGLIPIEDEVRLSAKDFLAFLAVDQSARGKVGKDDLARIEDQYFGEEINRLILAHQQTYAAAVRQVCGKAPAAVALAFGELHWRYSDRPLAIEDVAIETGYPLEVVRAVIFEQAKVELDHSFVRMLRGRKARRDQFEVAFASLIRLLVLTPEKKP